MVLTRVKYFLLIILAGAIASCAHKLYTKDNKVYQHVADSLATIIQNPPINLNPTNINYADSSSLTVNFNMRKPNYVILHHTEQASCDQTIRTFRLERTKVSAHYVICKNGTVVHMLNDYLRAWQAGISRWAGTPDINSYSIGIEIDNNGNESFNQEQINSLLSLLKYLKKKYNIPTANFIGHADIAPTRKDDPNMYFPWKQLADKGFGYWYQDTTAIQVPNSFDGVAGLRLIGYDTKDSIAAIKSFRLHFEQKPKTDSITSLDEVDKKIIFALLPHYN